MIWQDYAKTLGKTLGLKNHIVAITYTYDDIEGASDKPCRVCTALMNAYHGDTLALTAASSTCGGGTWHLGLGDPPKGEAGRALRNFLVHGEKLACSYATFHRMMALTTPPPRDVADRIIFAPMDAMPLEPDLAIFIVNAEQTCRLLTLYTYFTGKAPQTEMMGSGCHMAVAYPLVSGEMNVSFSDWTARPMMKMAPDEGIVSIPYYLLPGIIEAVPRCTAGTAEGRPVSDFLPGETMDE
jgi:uncharacterized protein (DUF169 family)